MRYSVNESGTIFVKYTTGDTVNVKVWDSGGKAETLTVSTASEISGEPGYFYWEIKNIQGLSNAHEDFLVVMDNGSFEQSFQAGIGGWTEL